MESVEHDNFIYKRVEIRVTNSVAETLDIEFDILTFHDMIRFAVEVVEREDEKGRYLDAIVRDKDYQFKLKNYR